MSKSKSPRQPGKAGQGANNKHLGNTPTTAAVEVQGLRFAIHRLDRSRNYLRFSLMEGQEVLDLLQRHPDPDAVAHISRQEQRVKRTEARLAEVQVSLGALYAALYRLKEVQHDPR